MAPLEPGTRLGGYDIVARLGVGGMGEVYKAHDRRLQRDVAIKLLQARRPIEAAPADLLREARAASSLNHPHICVIHEVGEDDGRAYIVMEHIAGVTLRDVIPAKGLPPETVLRYGIQLVDAVAHAHARGLIHGDLKCANVMVTPEGRIKVLDFGLARPAAAPAADVTRSGTSSATPTGGTPAYMAPELLRGQLPDVRSDIWALGVVLFELVSGGLPFTGDSGADTTTAILRDPPRELPDGIPATFKAAVHRALSKDPASRFGDAGQLGATLQILQADPSMGRHTEPRRAPRPSRRGAIRSIAVLPLDNLSADPSQDYFADGLTEAIITELARIGLLRVPSRTSVMRYRNSSKSAGEIAAELDVQALLEGSVVRIGDRVRVTAQLIDAATDAHLWTDSYDRDVRDIFELYSDLARGIAAEIRVRAPRQAPKITRVDPEAYEGLLKGQHLLSRRTEEGMQRALREFTASLAADPLYAPAHVGQADAYNLLGYYGVMAPRDAFPRAKAAARRALEINGSLGEPYASLGYATYYYDWEWAEAHAHFRRALDLNPRSAVARHWYSTQLAGLGEFGRALKEIESARELDRLSLPINVAMGLVLVLLRDYRRAIDVLTTCLELDPVYPLTHAWMGIACVGAGRLDQGRDAARWLEMTTPQNPALCAMAAYALARTGDLEAAQGALARLTHPADGRYVPAGYLAVAWAGTEDWTSTLDALARAVEDRSFNIVWPKTNPVFDGISSDPRFHRLLVAGRLAEAASSV